MSISSALAVSMMIGTVLRERSRGRPRSRRAWASSRRAPRGRSRPRRGARAPPGRRARAPRRTPPCAAGRSGASEPRPRRPRAECEVLRHSPSVVGWAGVIEARVYRAAFIPALLAVVLAMFSFQSRPGPLPQGLAADVLFDGAEAARLATRIATDQPDRRAGGRATPRRRPSWRTRGTRSKRAASRWSSASPTRAASWRT